MPKKRENSRLLPEKLRLTKPLGLETIKSNLNHQHETFVLKSTDELVNNSATLQDDDELFFQTKVGERWEFFFLVIYRSTTVADFKFDLSLPTNATSVGQYRRLGTGASALTAPFYEQTTDFTTDVASGGIGTNAADAIPIELRGTLLSGVGGKVVFRWAQNTAEATNTRVQSGSYLKAQRIG